MEEIIGEHLSSLGDFRSLSLIFDLEPPFIKNSIFGIEIYQKGGIYRNGKREGLWIFWHPNGRKESEGNYHNGKEGGLWIYWYQNGQKREEGNYRNGKREELWISWWPNGQKATEGNYRNGNLLMRLSFKFYDR